MTKPLPTRVDRLEQLRGPLPPSEAAELQLLEAGYAQMLGGEIEDWPEEKLDAFLAYCASDTAGRAGQLRAKMRSPAERAADAAVEAEIASMTVAELDAYLISRSAPAEEPSS